MTGALLSFVAVVLAGIGGRDQLQLAGFTARSGSRPALLIVAIVSGVATALIAGWASQIVAEVINSDARLTFAGLALATAGVEMIFARPLSVPAEPTNSLGAFALVLFARQLTDAARFLILAVAVATRAPVAAALGGALAAALLALGGWLGGSALADRDFTSARRVLGGALLIVALLVVLRGMGRI